MKRKKLIDIVETIVEAVCETNMARTIALVNVKAVMEWASDSATPSSGTIVKIGSALEDIIDGVCPNNGMKLAAIVHLQSAIKYAMASTKGEKLKANKYGLNKRRKKSA